MKLKKIKVYYWLKERMFNLYRIHPTSKAHNFVFSTSEKTKFLVGFLLTLLSNRLVSGEEIYDILQELYAMLEAKQTMDNKSNFIKNDNGDFCDKREWNAGVE